VQLKLKRRFQSQHLLLLLQPQHAQLVRLLY
jgi:hypothetical protein